MDGTNMILKGTPASPGRVKAKVKLILKPEDSDKLLPGEVLVARETTPEYISAMIKAAAIVTDIGGLLSHQAIVSRELGIPAVVGVKNAIQKLKDGMEVTVDGEKGTILAEGV